MQILGLSCDYHDAAAALVVDGAVVAAAEEERFTRLKHDSSLPERAIASVLAIGGIDANDIDVVVFHEKPLAVFSRVIAARQRRGLKSVGTFRREIPTLLSRNLLVGYRVERAMARLGAKRRPKIHYSEHHLSHAAAAFYPSPFSSAATLTIDGIGEWATASIGTAANHRIDLLEEQRYPDSLGLLYSLITDWCGFAPNDGEYKLMGLAPFGEPSYRSAIEELAQVHDDGSLSMDVRRLGWWSVPPSRLTGIHDLLGGPPLPRGAAPTQREWDLARSVQEFTEDAVLAMAQRASHLTGATNLCMAGGVALNCVANGRLLREGPFEHVWIQPAAGDAGSALGAALWFWHSEQDQPRSRPRTLETPWPDAMNGAQLGPAFDPDETESFLRDAEVAFTRIDDVDQRCAQVAQRLADGAVVGWFEGRMEFGPRALGHRSILADPRSPTVQRDINLRVKGRESFRPFAPAVLWERASEWFDIDQPSPYMLLTFQVAQEHLREVVDEPSDPFERVQVERSSLPACTHIDGSARVQTVERETHPTFHRLITAFDDLTGCPVLLNTSFNRAGEPVVCSPADALATAVAAGLDLLVIDHHLVEIKGIDSTEAGHQRVAPGDTT